MPSEVEACVQDQATPENLAQAIRTWLEDKQAREDLVTEFTRMHLELRQNTALLASDAVIGILHARGLC